jgi:hypothetical protein
MVVPVLVCPELSPQIVWYLIFWVLEVIFSVGRSFPDINDCFRDSFACLEIDDLAVHKSDFALVGREDDAATIFAEGCVGRPERTEDGAARWDIARFRGMLMGNFIDKAK